MGPSPLPLPLSFPFLSFPFLSFPFLSLISSFYFRGTKHICMYVNNQNSYSLAAGVVGKWAADILLKRPMAWRPFICSPAAVTILPVTMHTLNEGECISKEKSGVLRKGIILLARRNMENVEKKEKGKTTKFLVPM